MGGLRNLSWTPVVDFANAVKASLADLYGYMRSISWSTVWVNIKTNFESGTKTVGTTLRSLKDRVVEAGKTASEALSDFGDWIINGLQNVDFERRNAIGEESSSPSRSSQVLPSPSPDRRLLRCLRRHRLECASAESRIWSTLS